MNKLRSFFVAHKIISAALVVVIVGGGYQIYKKNTSTKGEVRYVLGSVTKGAIISSISGNGQVSASNQIDIKPNASGAITYLGIKPGNKVGSGQTLATINSADAQKAVRDAEISLESAQISLNKLKLQNSTENMNASLAKSYDDAFNSISNVFLDLPGIMSGMSDMFFKSSAGTQQQWNIDWYQNQVNAADSDQTLVLKQNFVDSFKTAQTAYNKNYENYKIIPRTASGATIEGLVTDTYNTSKLISDAIKNANNYIDFVNNSILKNNGTTPPLLTGHKATLNTYTSKTNNFLVDLLSSTAAIKNNKDAFPNSDLDTQSSELSVKQRENALADAKGKLSDYTIRAPFSGTITSVPVQKGDNVSSGTTVATLITTEQIATISLNEVDIAKIQLGQKVTLSFDAVQDLTITGKVVQIDSIGTTSQGVVSYSVKISFDTRDSRIKPGMSVSAAIITSAKQDVLLAPNSAIKNKAGSTYVEMFDAPLPVALEGVQGSPSAFLPRQQEVVVGISNDTLTEIISGLKEGDEIITRTIAPTSGANVTAPSILGSTNRGNTGGTRVPLR